MTELPSGEAAAGLGLAALEELALARNPTLVQAGAQVMMSRGKAVQAGLLPNPEVGYVAEQMGAKGTAGELQGMFVEQEFVTGGKLALSRQKYLQEARQAELQVLAQQFRVLYGVRVAYYEAIAWQRRLSVRRQLLENSEDASLTVRELVNTGQANQTDVLRAEVELERTRTDLRVAESRYRARLEALAAVVGEPDLAVEELKDALDFPNGVMPNRQATLSDLLACAPQLRFVRAEVIRDRIGLQRERVEPMPNVLVRGESGYNFEVEDAVAGVEIGLRLPLFDRNQGTILQAEAELSRAVAEVERVELMLRKRFAETFAEYETARLSAATYRERILPKAEEMYQANQESFKQRRAAWPQVLAAHRDYLDFYEHYLDRLLAARRAEALLDSYLLGDGLSQPPEPTPEGHRDSVAKPR